MVEDQRGRAEGRWDIDAEVVEEFYGVARPSNGDRGGSKKVFQDKVPANDPRKEFA